MAGTLLGSWRVGCGLDSTSSPPRTTRRRPARPRRSARSPGDAALSKELESMLLSAVSRGPSNSCAAVPEGVWALAFEALDAKDLARCAGASKTFAKAAEQRARHAPLALSLRGLRATADPGDGSRVAAAGCQDVSGAARSCVAGRRWEPRALCHAAGDLGAAGAVEEAARRMRISRRLFAGAARFVRARRAGVCALDLAPPFDDLPSLRRRPAESRAARERSANSAQFLGEAALPLLRESRGTMRELHLSRDAVGFEALGAACALLCGPDAPFARLRVLQLVGALRSFVAAADGAFQNLAQAAPGLEALEVRELDLAAAQPKTRLAAGGDVRGADVPARLAAAFTRYFLDAPRLRVLWADNVWLDGGLLEAAADEVRPLVDARFFAVEPGSDPAAGDAGVAALVAFVAAKRPALEVLVVEGSHATLADAAPLDAREDRLQGVARSRGREDEEQACRAHAAQLPNSDSSCHHVMFTRPSMKNAVDASTSSDLCCSRIAPLTVDTSDAQPRRAPRYSRVDELFEKSQPQPCGRGRRSRRPRAAASRTWPTARPAPSRACGSSARRRRTCA